MSGDADGIDVMATIIILGVNNLICVGLGVLLAMVVR